jgi:hypothetical protein
VDSKLKVLIIEKRAFSSFLIDLFLSGHVLIDRYKSLQRRNIIEPRIRQTVVYKYKHKVFTKRSHSEPKGLKVGKRNNIPVQ